MSYGRDFDAPEAADAMPVDPSSTAAPVWARLVDADFIGPLRPAEQAWAEHVLRADSSAALFEPADNVIRRREAHISALYRTAALLALSGELAGGSAAGFRAIAEARALAEFLAANPAYCLDCFVLGERCEQHRTDFRGPGPHDAGAGPAEDRPAGGSGSDGPKSGGPRSGGTGADGRGAGRGGSRPGPGPGQPEWRRFGADEFPSAGG
jgi:hypothetical protein